MNLTNLFEGAIDDLEMRRIEDLELKMDSLAREAKAATDPKIIAALRHEFAKAKAERDSYHYVKEWEDTAPGHDRNQTGLTPVEEGITDTKKIFQDYADLYYASHEGYSDDMDYENYSADIEKQMDAIEQQVAQRYSPAAVKKLQKYAHDQFWGKDYNKVEETWNYATPWGKEAAIKQKATISRPASTSKDKVKTFAAQGYTIKFKPDVVEIYHGADLVYSKPGDFANPTRAQLGAIRGRVTDLANRKKKQVEEEWSQKYKDSINCANPKGFSQKAHCASKNEAANPAQQAAIAISMKEKHQKPKANEAVDTNYTYTVFIDGTKEGTYGSKEEAKEVVRRKKEQAPGRDYRIAPKPRTSARSIKKHFSNRDRYVDEAEERLRVSPHDQGAHAAVKGKPYSSNPHPAGSKERLEWSRGHNSMRARKLQDVEEHIVKHGSQYRLLSKKGKNLGDFPSHKAAAKHEGEVEYFKHKDEVKEEHEPSPVASAIVRRIMFSHPDLLQDYGPNLVNAAVDNVADYVGDVEEIGSSDVSAWVKQVERMLKENPPEAFDEGWSNKMVARRTGQAPTPWSVYINGKEWKSFPDDDHAENVANKLRAKFKAEGRDPSVITIAATGYDKDVEEGSMTSAEHHPTGPEFTGYWKGTDSATPGNKMVGGCEESVEPKGYAARVNALIRKGLSRSDAQGVADAEVKQGKLKESENPMGEKELAYLIAKAKQGHTQPDPELHKGDEHEINGDQDQVGEAAPRNFVVKNMKQSGQGKHKDAKRAMKQGDVKHKKQAIPMDEDSQVDARKLKAAQDTAKFIMRNWDDRQALKMKAPLTWNPERFYQGATAAMRGADFDEIVKIVYQDEPAKFEEGAKVDRMQKHIAKSEKDLGHSKKDAEAIGWATLNKRGYLDNANKKKHNESVNFMEWAVAQGSRFANFAGNPEVYAQAKQAFLAEGFGTSLANVSSKISGHPRKMKSAQQIRNKAMKFAPQPIAEDDLEEDYVSEIKKGQKDSNDYTKCWTGYHAQGTKTGKNGGRVRNCVKNESIEESADLTNLTPDEIKGIGMMIQNGHDIPTIIRIFDNKPTAQQITAIATANMQQGVAEEYKGNVKDTELKNVDPDNHSQGEGDFVKNQLHSMKRVITHLDNAIGRGEDLPDWVQSEIAQAADKIVGVMDYSISSKEQEIEQHTGNSALMKEQSIEEDWQKANKRDKTDGMSKKAVKSYRREHPGSKLQTAVTTKPSKLKKGSKASKRRSSYCSRSKGQMDMHNISCAKTPDKAICKARRRWNCEGVENLEAMLAEAIEKGTLQPGQYYIWEIFFDDGTKKRIKVTKDNFDPKAYYAKLNRVVINTDYDWTVHG